MSTSRVLIIGATGTLGFHLAKLSIDSSHPTFALVRESAFSDSTKSQKIQFLSDAGAILVKGSLDDEESLIEAVKRVDVVICSIPSKQVLEQKLLIRVIRQVGCIKRFIPSEFGQDPDQVRVSNMDSGFYSSKAEIRRLIESQGIPYTYISCNFFMRYLLPSLVQPRLKAPPRDKVIIFGDGDVRGVFVNEIDVAAFTVCAMDDPRTLNKTVHLRPRGCVYSMNELVDIWESKIQRKLERVYVSEEEVLRRIEETPYPEKMELVFIYSAFVKGNQTYFDVEASGGVEGTDLFPHLKYTTIGEFFDRILYSRVNASLPARIGEWRFQFLERKPGGKMAPAHSKSLVIGGTGYIGKFIVEASARSGRPTYVLVRESTLNHPAKAKIIENFKGLGVTLLYGDLFDHGSLVKAIKEVSVVVSAVGSALISDQDKIIEAIKEAGNVERFLPSEFGNDVDRQHAVEPAKTAYGVSREKIRRKIEAEKIPHTYISSNCFDGYFLPNLSQSGATSPPRDKVTILGDGNPKAVFNKEEDIAEYTVRAMDDPRTLNKTLYIRPPGNIYSFNDLVSLWERKIGKTLERLYIPEEQVLEKIKESSAPTNVYLALGYSVFVKGDQTNFEIEPSFGVEASEIYPDVKYTSVDEYLNQFV